MAQDTKVSDLIINKGLTVEELSEKYAQGLIGDNELAIVDTEETVVQTDAMPVASAEEFGSIVQYVGADTQDYTNGYFYKCTSETTQASATISTTSPNIYDLEIDLDTFVAEEQPTGSETVEFVRGLVNEHQEIEAFNGVSATISDPALLKSSWIDLDPTNRMGCSFDYQNAADDLWTVTDQAGNNYYWHTSDFASYGITVTGTPIEGSSYIGYWTAGDWAWKKNDTAVNIADYGITYQGYDEESGVTITVDYTAGVTTYSWENIEVQPASGGGITWTAFLDLPYPPQTLRARLKLGALPDGRYEFYTSTNMTASNNNNYPPMIFKVRLRLDRANNQTTLVANPVLGEGWISGGSQSLIKNGINRTYTLYYKSEDVNTLYFIPDVNGFLTTDIQQGYMTSADDGVGCFKATSVKNIETGEEYPTELEFSPNYTGLNSIYSHLECPLLVAQEAYSNAENSGWRIDQVNYVGIVLQYANITYSNGLVSQIGVDISAVSGSDEFVCRVEFFPFDKMQVTVKKCTGAFIGTKVGTSPNYRSAIAIKPPVTFVDKDISVIWKIDSFNTSEYMSIWGLGTNDPFTEIGTFNVGSIIDPTNYGAIVQYDGQTDASYTNGYFYKATGTLVDIPGSVDCIEQNQDPNITISMDVDGFIAACSTIYGQESSEWWQYALDTNYYGWWWSYDMANNLIYWDCYGWLDASLTQYFTISTTRDFTFGTYNYVPKTQEVQGGAWTQTDVQPTPVIPDPLPSQTGNSGKFLTTDGTDASWSDKPLVNSATGNNSLTVGGIPTTTAGTVNVGKESFAIANSTTVVGSFSSASGQKAITIGSNSLAGGTKGISIGFKTRADANGSIQIGNYNDANTINSDANTFKVANDNGNFEIMSADGTIPTDRLINAINKYSTMPTAASTNEGWIVQFTGTTDANYTHGYIYECKAQGTNPETYAWEAVEVQASSGGGLQNTATGTDSLTILGIPNVYTTSVNIGVGSQAGSDSVTIGYNANDAGHGVVLGRYAHSYSWGNNVVIGNYATSGTSGFDYSVIIGSEAKSANNVVNCIQLGGGTNPESNTFYVALNSNNYKLLGSDGSLPADRLASTTGLADGNYRLRLTMASGVPTLSWVAE